METSLTAGNMYLNSSDICGPAMVVVELDPLQATNDPNRTNNIIYFPVWVDCSKGTPGAVKGGEGRRGRGRCSACNDSSMQG